MVSLGEISLGIDFDFCVVEILEEFEFVGVILWSFCDEIDDKIEYLFSFSSIDGRFKDDDSSSNLRNAK